MKIKSVIETAVQMEEKGKKYYESAAAAVKSADVKAVFEALAVEEDFHKKHFLKMLDSAGDGVFEGASDEFIGTFMSYSGNKPMFDTAQLKESLESDEPGSIVRAIEFAMDRELEAVIYYTSIMAAVSAGSVREIQDIIDEEMKHFVKLSKARELVRK